MTNIQAKLILEAEVNKSLKEMAQHIYNEHKLRVNEIHITWINCSTPAKQRFIAGSIRVETESY